MRIENAEVFYEGSLRNLDIGIRDGVIEEVESDLSDRGDEEIIDASGKIILPGAIDVHVHFREPGYTHKEDWWTGSRSAAAGGVTTAVDQPNTSPPTVDGESFKEKLGFAEEKSVIDLGINAGVNQDWKGGELFELPVTAYGEVFMADSTGEMGVGREKFEEVVKEIQRHNELVTVHAEDSSKFVSTELEDADDWASYRSPEAEIEAVRDAIEIAEKPLHFAHISHPESVKEIDRSQHTCEVTPHHLFLSRDDLEELGNYGKMNPPLRTEEARKEMWENMEKIDAVATDHAPHTVEEKSRTVEDAPSGVPGVETMLPLMLGEVVEDRIKLGKVVELVSKNPAEIFGFSQKGSIREGKDADLVLVEKDGDGMFTEEIRAEKLHSKAEWTPFEGFEGVFPEKVLCRGETVYEKDRSFGRKGYGRLVNR